MLQDSLLTSQLSLASDLLPKTSRLHIALGVLLSVVVFIPVAQAASCKLPKSYYKNVSCTANSSYFLAVKDFGAPVALLNSSGKKVVDLSRYQQADADKLSGGLLPVLRNSHVGYVNMQGREVIPTMYDMLNESGGKGWARPVSEGRIVVKKGGDYGVISTSNDTIVPFSSAISNIDNYRSGVASVRKNKDSSLVDKNGKATGNPNAKRDNSSSMSNNASLSPSQALSSPQSRPPNTPSFTTLQPHQQDGKWGFVDDKDVTMITYSFDDVRPFSESLAGVRVDDKWGFVNLGGELTIPFRFDESSVDTGDIYKGVSAFIFKDGKAWIGSLQNGDKMCIDKEGQSVGCD
jgi:hypothetical protein